MTGVANTDVIFTDKLQIGDGQDNFCWCCPDMQLFHDGTSSFIHGTTGTRQLNTSSRNRMVNESKIEIIARFIEGGGVELSW